MREKVKITFTDFYSDTCSELIFFKELLERRYELVPSADPDFVFYSTFGNAYLNFDCTRVFYTGENIRPNFNVCDYALGFDFLTFEDRYYRLPFYRHWPSFALIKENKILGLHD